MLDQFITTNRDEIIARCRAKISNRPAPRPTDDELANGVPLFLDQLTDALRTAQGDDPAIGTGAAKHSSTLMKRGFTVAQIVHDYGNVCQTITALAVETAADITVAEFQMLNLCLDNAIAGAVTEYGHVRDHEGVERLGHLAHELRNLLNAAVLSYDALMTGNFGIGGSTGKVLGRSLSGLRNLIDRQLADVRFATGAQYREDVVIRDFIEDVEVGATMEANASQRRFVVVTVPPDVIVNADRQILASVVNNLLQNAFKFTHEGGEIVLRVHTTRDRVLIDVEDQCGGLAPDKEALLFKPYEQGHANRKGLGLGLNISMRGARANDGTIHVRNKPGEGCVFTLDLPRARVS